MLNMEELKMLKMMKANSIDKVLSAGPRYLGMGWSPERARDRLMALTGYFLVEPKFTSYLQTWLLTIALVTGASLPPLNLSQEATAAAFALAAAFEQQAPTGGEKAAEHPGNLQFPWDEEKKELPRELQELWRRAQKGEKSIDMQDILKGLPAWDGMPSRAPQNNLAGDHPQDRRLKGISEQVLHLLHAQAHTLDHSDRQLQLQCWQWAAQLYFWLQKLRKDLAVPDCKSGTSKNLFTMNDVEHHRLQQQLHSIRSKHEKEKFSLPMNESFVFNGRNKLSQQGYPFRSATGTLQGRTQPAKSA